MENRGLVDEVAELLKGPILKPVCSTSVVSSVSTNHLFHFMPFRVELSVFVMEDMLIDISRHKISYGY